MQTPPFLCVPRAALCVSMLLEAQELNWVFLPGMVGILAVARGGAEPGVTIAPTDEPRDSAPTGHSPAPSSAQRKQRGRLALRGESSDGVEAGWPAFIPDRPLTKQRDRPVQKPVPRGWSDT